MNAMCRIKGVSTFKADGGNVASLGSTGECSSITHNQAQIFPRRLMGVLADASNRDGIRWAPGGKSFYIVDREFFLEQVMPKFSPRKSKFSSFLRKLNRWGFSRLGRGPTASTYCHRFFVKDRPQLVEQMYYDNKHTRAAMQASSESGLKNLHLRHLPQFSPRSEEGCATMGSPTSRRVAVTHCAAKHTNAPSAGLVNPITLDMAQSSIMSPVSLNGGFKKADVQSDGLLFNTSNIRSLVQHGSISAMWIANQSGMQPTSWLQHFQSTGSSNEKIQLSLISRYAHFQNLLQSPVGTSLTW